MSDKENLDLCPECRSTLRTVNTYMTFKNDDTPEFATEAYTNLDLACGNQNCSLYVGEDLSNPIVLARTVSHKVN